MATVSIGVVLTFVLGCSQAPTTAQQDHDPLRGFLTPPGLPQSPGTSRPANNSATQPAPGVPAMPTSYHSTSNATLASMTWQGPLGRPLAIDDDGRPYVPGQMGGPPPRSVPIIPAANPNPRVEPVPDLIPTSPMKQAASPVTNWMAPVSQ